MKFEVHHLVTGASMFSCEVDTSKGSRHTRYSGAAVTASSLFTRNGPRVSIRGQSFADHHKGGATRLRGVWVDVRWPVSAYAEAGELRLWAEATVWDDDTPDRLAVREAHGGDTRTGFGRTHAILWPSKGHADRHREEVSFVDPASLDKSLRTAPPMLILEDDPCPECDGTGTRTEQRALAEMLLRALKAEERVAELETALDVLLARVASNRTEPPLSPDAIILPARRRVEHVCDSRCTHARLLTRED